MTVIRIVSAAALSFAALAAYAQQSTPPQPDQGAMMAAGAKCTEARKARHDHGIERGYGPMAIRGCAPTRLAVARAIAAEPMIRVAR